MIGIAHLPVHVRQLRTLDKRLFPRCTRPVIKGVGQSNFRNHPVIRWAEAVLDVCRTIAAQNCQSALTVQRRFL